MKKIYLFAGAMCITGFILVVIAFLMTGGNLKKFNSGTRDYVPATYNCKEDIDSIDAEAYSQCITLRTGNVDKPVIEYYNDKEYELWDISEDNGTLKIRRPNEVRNQKSYFIINFDTQNYDGIRITLPENFKGDAKLKVSSGEIMISDVNFNKLDEHLSSGYAALTRVNVSTVTAEASSGTIHFNHLNADSSIDFKVSSGEIIGDIDGSEKDFSVNTSVSSGDTNLKNSQGGKKELSATASSGDIIIRFNE
ncbi:MAG: DUF4097 domain-containing protein [Lachnospiraceae bacterium]|nr:DUF4097 domain-containing protein [Lachnospiraceae bacterium]